MNAVSHKTAIAMYQAGLPKPESRIGTFWSLYGKLYIQSSEGSFGCSIQEVSYQSKTEWFEIKQLSRIAIPLLTLEDITPHLPQTFALEMWDGRHSCTNRCDENPLRTFGSNFAEAAAEMYLKIKEVGTTVD